jgi:superfamily II DNA or RNA helicase
VTTTAEPEIARLAFSGTWRHYQALALEAFENDRRSGHRRTHIVAPPGSGKTLLGMEIVRRLGARALVLVPNTAVQEQWLRAAGKFGAAGNLAAADPSAPVACLTYQALCQLDDPAAALGDVAARRWAAERAQATGTPVADVERDVLGWTGAAAARRKRELARITASLKREIARAGHGWLGFGELLSAGAQQRIHALRNAGVGTIVLDECHHLASMWGYVVRQAIGELGDVHLLGLTATPPDALTTEEADLYGSLLGPVDFTVPTPALVRERALAPYQELAWLTRPLESEASWLAEHDLRFTELITALHEDNGGVQSLPSWVISRMRQRSRTENEAAAVSWAGFQRRHPALARAGARFLASGGLEPPPGVPRGEGYREPPDLDDWMVLLEDYALHCLAAGPSDAAAARYEGISAGLRALGFTLTRHGIRRGASDTDRLLMSSAAKSAALTDVVGCEFEARGERLRALVLADTEVASVPAASLAGVLRPEAGSAPEALRALAADPRTAPLRPLLVSGRGLRCAEQDAGPLLAALAGNASPAGMGGRTTGIGVLRAEPGERGLVRLAGSGAAWQPRLWVELATRIFTAGSTRLLVGTRALLGEGWDAPCLNCLVDLSSAATAMAVAQSRGRALRLDPGDPDKIASNWDIVCVAPELTRGTADYERFVRKHLHLFAPSEDGAIEAGPSHVHPALGPFAPPPADMFDGINRDIARRAAGHEQARERWGIGQPYAGTEQQTLVILPRRAGRPRPVPEQPPRYRAAERPPRWPVPFAAAATTATVAVTAVSGQPAWLAYLAVAAAPAGLAGLRLARAQRWLDDALPLDLVAHAICDAYRDLGELTEQAAASLAIEPRASGYLRCYLRAATAEESARFTSALDGALAPDDFPRYLISRLVPARGRNPLRPLGRLLARKPPFDRRWVAVPDDFGRTRQRAEAYAQAWRRWLGPAELQFTQRTQAGRQAAADAEAQRSDYQTSSRRIWV